MTDTLPSRPVDKWRSDMPYLDQCFTRKEVLSNPYLRYYTKLRDHQRGHGGLMSGRPFETCLTCLRERHEGKPPLHEVHSAIGGDLGAKRYYSWAVPDDAALSAIASHSPGGVVEIGAGGGYWSAMLRARGVDVVAYDPDPRGEHSNWFCNKKPWSEVLRGDETVVIGHSDRTLLTVWPCYAEGWTDRMLDLYGGDTVIYVGEGVSGCTGSDRMHALLGEAGWCWHDEDEADTCSHATAPEARFELKHEQAVPQFAGVHDRLFVYKRLGAP